MDDKYEKIVFIGFGIMREVACVCGGPQDRKMESLNNSVCYL